VGLSMGGFVGQRIAARKPHLVRSLTLLDTSAGPEDPADAAQFKRLAAVYRLTGIPPLRNKVLPLMFGPVFLADPGNAAVIAEWERRLGRCRRAGISRAVRGVADRAGVDAEIGSITAPTLVLVGADDAATPVAKSQAIAAKIPGARLEVIPDCGHSSTREQPHAVTGLIRGFLESIPT